MILTWIDHHARSLLCIALALIFLLAGLLVWSKLHPPHRVTFESQQQASTPVGVEKAANAAQVPISATQAAVIASTIKDDENKAPDVVIQTTGAKLKEMIQVGLQKSDGQFAIVTDFNKDSANTNTPSVAASKPSSTSNISKNALTGTGTILPNTPVMLNQYNIRAYPDRLIQIGGSYQEVFAAYSWRISVPKIPVIVPHGDIGYLGIYSHTNFDHPTMSRIGIVLTITR